MGPSPRTRIELYYSSRFEAQPQGIVFLPGAMVGLILAGTDPTDAVLVQISVMYLVLGSVATTSAVMSIGLSRQLFTPAQQLRRFEPADDSVG